MQSIPGRRGRCARRRGNSASLLAARAAHAFAQQLRKSQRARPRSVAIREDEIELQLNLVAAAQRQRLQNALIELAANLLFGVPRVAVAARYGADRGRHIADRPALLSLDRARALVAHGSRIAHDQVTMLTQIPFRDLAA